MPRIRYGVAMSLDGYLAGPNGEADWIVMDPAIDFAAIWAQFDILLMGRRTYDVAVKRLGMQILGSKRVVVASRTLYDAEPGIEILREITPATLAALRNSSKQDIWLMGGGELFGVLLAMGEVDAVEVSLMPVLLGGGVPLLPTIAQRTALRLVQHQVYPSGTVILHYDRVR